MVGFPHHSIVVKAHSELFKHCVDIGSIFMFSAFVEADEALPTFVDKSADVLEFLRAEAEAGTSQEQEVAFFELFVGDVGFVDVALRQD